MKDPSDQIISAFYTALNGNLAYSGTNWPVYTSAPSGTNYVLIGDLDLVDASAKIERLHEGTIMVEIVNGGNYKNFSKKKINDIADDIVSRIAYVYLSMTGFSFCVAPYVDSMQTFDEINDTEIVIRKIITFRFIVQQTT